MCVEEAQNRCSGDLSSFLSFPPIRGGWRGQKEGSEAGQEHSRGLGLKLQAGWSCGQSQRGAGQRPILNPWPSGQPRGARACGECVLRAVVEGHIHVEEEWETGNGN